jgi:hypothetical protein
MRGGQHRNSGREFAAALATPGLQDGASGAGSHPQTEAVGLGPAAVVRLEGPLAHGLAPSQSSHLMHGNCGALGWVDNAPPESVVTSVEQHRQWPPNYDGTREFHGTE